MLNIILICANMQNNMEKMPTKIPINEGYLSAFSRIKDNELEKLLRELSKNKHLIELKHLLERQDDHMDMRNFRGNYIASGIVPRRVNIEGVMHYQISRLCEACIYLSGSEEANASLTVHFRRCLKYYPELKKYFLVRKRKQERLYAAPENFAKFLADFFVIYDIYRKLKWPEKP